VKKMIATMVGVGVFASASIFAVMATASPASADTCQESLWGQDMWGNKQFDCPDGSYTMTKPFGTSTWDDPWANYELKKDSAYSSNRWTGRCTYNSFYNSYDCTEKSNGWSSSGYSSYSDPFSFNDPFSSGW